MQVTSEPKPATRRRRRYQRHPALVTSDRLKGHVEKWYAKMSGQERDDFGYVIQVLEEIGEHQR